jgi:hypothetical protein
MGTFIKLNPYPIEFQNLFKLIQAHSVECSWLRSLEMVVGSIHARSIDLNPPMAVKLLGSNPHEAVNLVVLCLFCQLSSLNRKQSSSSRKYWQPSYGQQSENTHLSELRMLRDSQA